MTAVTRPRGPLPPRVYWTRRALLLVLPLALVYAVAHLLAGGGVGGSQGGSSATPVAHESSAAASPAAPRTAPTAPPVTGTPTVPAPTGTRAAAATPLPAPSGTCAGSDVVVTPAVQQPAYAGRPVVFSMSLQTTRSPACTWTASSSSLVVKVTSGTSRFWSTQDCVASVPRQVVVVRRDTPVTVPVTWDGQRSDADCSRATPWAEPGAYHVLAVAFGNPQPVEQQFELAAPPRATVTATPTPDQRARVMAAQRARLAARAAADRQARLTPSATPQPSPRATPRTTRHASPTASSTAAPTPSPHR